MIKPEDIAVGDVVRLVSGSPKFTVTKLEAKDGGIVVSVLGWSDRLGFVEDEIPLELLVWPRSAEVSND